MLKAKLVVVGGDAQQTEIDLSLPTLIGRGRDVGLTVPHALVSRRHTEIFEQDGKLYVRDLGSLNGTFVNNKRIEAPQPLEPNQLLTLGTVTFRAIYNIGNEFSNAETDFDPETILIKNAPSGPTPTSPPHARDASSAAFRDAAFLNKETVGVDEVRTSGTKANPAIVDDLISPPRQSASVSSRIFSAAIDSNINLDAADDLQSESLGSSMLGSFVKNLPR